MTYAGEVFYPVYHSVHDTYKWLQGLIDPNFVFHLTTAKVATRFLMYTADSFVLPLDVTEYGKSLDSSFAAFREDYENLLKAENVTLTYISNAIDK